MLNRTMIAALALAALVGVAGCGPSKAPTETGATPSKPAGEAAAKKLAPMPTVPASLAVDTANKTYTIGMSQCNLGEPWRVQMNKDVADAAAKFPYLKVVFKDAQNKSDTQRAQVEEFVQDKVDLIIISPKEAQPLTAPVAEAVKAGIPVIVLDRALIGDKYTCFIGGDNVRIGKAAGEWLVKKLGNKGKVVELKGLMTSTPGQDRNTGFREGIKGSGLEVIHEAEMKWLEPDARKEMESALARYPKIDAVYAHNDPGAHGAYLAAQSAGRDKEMIFIGIDALPQEGVMYVKKGMLAATFQYPTGGKEAIDIARMILSKQEVPKDIVLNSLYFTKENVDKGGEPLP